VTAWRVSGVGSRMALAATVALCILVRASAASSQTRLTGDVGLVTYIIAGDRAAAFERVVARAIQGLKGGGTVERPRAGIGLRLFRAMSADVERVLFVLLIEPVTPGEDYSLEHLISTSGDPDAEALLREFALATAGGAPFTAGLQSLASVSPTDALRSRLEVELAGALNPPGNGTAETRSRDGEQLERLKQPLGVVDQVRYEVADRSPSTWRFRWTAAVRNPSLVQSFIGTVTVELRDAGGTIVAATPPIAVQIDRLEERSLSGELIVNASAAARVVAGTAQVHVRP
jgi:hypothetical protein